MKIHDFSMKIHDFCAVLAQRHGDRAPEERDPPPRGAGREGYSTLSTIQSDSPIDTYLSARIELNYNTKRG